MNFSLKRRIVHGSALLLAAVSVMTLGEVFCSAQEAQPNFQALLRQSQNWKTACMPKGCILSADILRGAYGGAPDSQHVNQYISIAVAVDRSTMKTHFLMFEVDPHADANAGIVLTFAHTVPDGKSWKVVFDPHGTFPLPLNRCNPTTCDAILPAGVMKDGTDVLAKMQSGTHLFLLYTKGDQTYRTAVDLDLFQAAYQKMLTDMKAAPPNHRLNAAGISSVANSSYNTRSQKVLQKTRM
jgi:invasion protein IalB